MRRMGQGPSAIVCVVALLAGAPASLAETLEFEDLFGPCGDFDLVRGPGTVEIEGVLFTTPDLYSYNVGRENSFPPGLGNPFESDSYHFFTFGPGASIDFPAAVDALHFITGERTNMSDWPTFRLMAEGSEVATFGANIWTPEVVDVSFPHPVSRVVIQFVQGSSSILGIDSFRYTPAVSGAPESPVPPGLTFVLEPPYPNPAAAANGAIVLPLALSHESQVRLDLLDAAGRFVATRAPFRCPAGSSRIVWTFGACPRGVYWIRASSEGRVSSRAIVLAGGSIGPSR